MGHVVCDITLLSCLLTCQKTYWLPLEDHCTHFRQLHRIVTVFAKAHLEAYTSSDHITHE